MPEISSAISVAPSLGLGSMSSIGIGIMLEGHFRNMHFFKNVLTIIKS